MNHSKKTLKNFSKALIIRVIAKSDKKKIKGGIGDTDLDNV